MIFLHGAGERGTDINLVKKHGPPKLADQKKDFPFIIVSPQCPSGQWWDAEAVNVLVDEIIAEHAVDPTRVYLTGLSMGGYGTWDLACRHPERFAAIAPICGGGIPFLAFDNLKKMPTWAFHGAKDQTVPLSESERMVEALKNAGAEVKFTVYPDAGHDSWSQAYGDPELYRWLLSHRK